MTSKQLIHFDHISTAETAEDTQNPAAIALKHLFDLLAYYGILLGSWFLVVACAAHVLKLIVPESPFAAVVGLVLALAVGIIGSIFLGSKKGKSIDLFLRRQTCIFSIPIMMAFSFWTGIYWREQNPKDPDRLAAEKAVWTACRNSVGCGALAARLYGGSNVAWYFELDFIRERAIANRSSGSGGAKAQ